MSPRPDGGLALRYRVAARGGVLRVPVPVAASATVTATDGLWRHTCCEIFLARQGEPAYREFNFSPSGEWAAYAFRAPRERDEQVIADWPMRPEIRCTTGDDGFTLDAVLRAGDLPAGSMPFEIGLSAVLESTHPDGSLSCSYWALNHPAPQPDFHQRAAFALRLDPQTLLP